jgi:hypothetical protein
VARRGAHARLVADLDDPPEVHHGDPVAEVPDDRQVVRDEDVAEAEAVPQRAQQPEHLRLDGHVKRGHRFVADEDFRPDRQRPGQGDALPFTAGELVRVAAGGIGPQADELEQFGHPPRPAGRRAEVPVNLQRLAHRFAGGHPRVERGVRVLQHELDVPPRLAQRRGAQRVQVLVPEQHLAAGRRLQRGQRPGQG